MFSNRLMFRIIVISVIIPRILTDSNSIAPRLGFWSVRDCILARLSMKFIVPLTDLESENNILEISLPPTAKVYIDSDGNDCRDDNGKDQKLTLLWKQEGEKNNVTFTFAKEKSYYGIRRIRGDFKIKSKSSTNTIIVDTEPLYHMEQNKTLMFLTPNNDSYSCPAGVKINLFAKTTSDGNESRNSNATIVATHLQFDAFRNVSETNHTSLFRRESYRPIECGYKTESIVPPVVSLPIAFLLVCFVIFVSAFTVIRCRKNVPYQTFR